MKTKLRKILNWFRRPKPPSKLTEAEEHLFHMITLRTRADLIGGVLDTLEYEKELRKKLLDVAPAAEVSLVTKQRIWATVNAVRKVEDAIYALFNKISEEKGGEP